MSDPFKDAELRMVKSIETLKNEFHKIRTGNAHPSLLEHIKVTAYGSDVPLSQVANITIGDAAKTGKYDRKGSIAKERGMLNISY
mgnify:CR=1 FL=1